MISVHDWKEIRKKINIFKSFSLLRCSPYWTERSKDQRIWCALRTQNSYILIWQPSPAFVKNTQVDWEALAGFLWWASVKGSFIQKSLNMWVWNACLECQNSIGLGSAGVRCHKPQFTCNYTETTPDPQCYKWCWPQNSSFKCKAPNPLVNSWAQLSLLSFHQLHALH